MKRTALLAAATLALAGAIIAGIMWALPGTPTPEVAATTPPPAMTSTDRHVVAAFRAEGVQGEGAKIIRFAWSLCEALAADISMAELHTTVSQAGGSRDSSARLLDTSVEAYCPHLRNK